MSMRCTPLSDIIILSIYVDDLLLILRHVDDIIFLKQKLHECLKLKDVSPMTRILGITVQHNFNTGTIDLSQPDKVAELATEFSLADCKTPASSYKLPYHHNVGALLWVALTT